MDFRFKANRVARLLGVVLLLICASSCFAQGAHRLNQVLARGSSVSAQVVPYAQILVCTAGTSCTPASLYSNLELTITAFNPVTADASGNYSYYVATGCYDEYISAPGTTSRALFNVCSGSVSGSGSVTSFSAGDLSPLFTTSVATATTTPALTFTLSNAAQNSVLAGPSTGGAGAYSFQTAPTISAANMTGFTSSQVTTALGFTPAQAFSLTTTGTSGAATYSANILNIPQYAGGVTSINSTPGAYTFDFSSGAGSCSGTTCTFTGSGTGGGSVTDFIAASGSWPSWLVPSVATSTTTPTLSVSASAIPNASLAAQTANTVLGALTATTPSGLAMPSCSGSTNALIWTTSTGFGCNTISGGGSGTVTSVALTLPSWLTVTGSPITSSGTLAVTGTSETANYFLAAPNGSSGAMTPRAIVAADIPTLNQNTSGNAATATALASSPAQCSGGKFATGVTTSGAANCNSNLDDGSTAANTLTYAGSAGVAAKSFTSTGSAPGRLQLYAATYATIVAAYPCNSGNKGNYAEFTDSTTNTWGASITTGGGSYEVGGHCNGTNYTVFSQ